MMKLPLLIKAFLAIGMFLATVVSIQGTLSYLELGSHMVQDHVVTTAVQQVALLEVALRGAVEPERLESEIRSLLMGNESITSIRVFDQSGAVLAATPGAPAGALRSELLNALFDRREREAVEHQADGLTTVVVPLRFRFTGEEISQGSATGELKYKIAEIVLRPTATTEVVWRLRRRLVLAIASSTVLVALLTSVALLFGRHQRASALEQQLSLAERVQRELLPSPRTAFRNVRVHAQLETFWEVGGDYYDVLDTPAGATSIVLADVSGKGLAAALLAAVVHGAVRAVAAGFDGTNHGTLATQVNDLLVARTAGNQFVTLFWAFFDPERRTLSYINAGHPPPFLLRRIDGTIVTIPLPTTAIVLGLFGNRTFEEATVDVLPDDILCLYSDGISEMRNQAGDELGVEHLEAMIARHAGPDPALFASRLVADLARFRGRTAIEDDATLMLVELLPDARAEAGAA
jgi:serine phosphatase RsbU (regulator of sigma subunit)